MKNTFGKIIACTAMMTCLSAVTGYGATLTWDNGGAGNLYSTANNWNPNQAPVGGDTTNISNGDTVAHAQNLPGGVTVNLTGNSTLTTDGAVIRLNNSTLNVASGSTLTGNFWDLDGANITFDDGAIASMANWEQKDLNTFTYNLGATGFSTLTPNTFRIGNGGLPGNIANATYVVDFANYSGFFSDEIVLMDFVSDAVNLTDAQFQTASFSFLNVPNFVASQELVWDPATDRILLQMTQTAPEPSTLGLLGMGAIVLYSTRRRK